jgi:hypothetical protein
MNPCLKVLQLRLDENTKTPFCESQLVTVIQDIADSLDEAFRTDAIVIDFSKAFDLVPHDRLKG